MRLDHLNAHKRTHLDYSIHASTPGVSKPQEEEISSTSTLRPFPCTSSPNCKQRFWTRQHLERHVKGVHDDSRAWGDQTETEVEGAISEAGEEKEKGNGNGREVEGEDGSTDVSGGHHKVDDEGKKRKRKKRPGGDGAYKVSSEEEREREMEVRKKL